MQYKVTERLRQAVGVLSDGGLTTTSKIIERTAEKCAQEAAEYASQNADDDARWFAGQAIADRIRTRFALDQPE